jgi:DNA-binding NarL/FixJ family response regulator
MVRRFSIVVAEPALLLREKIAGVLARDEKIWCVTQVQGLQELMRGVADIHPDFILADLSVLKDPETVRLLKRSSENSRIFALVDSLTEPYLEAARRLDLDGIIDKGRVIEGMREHLRAYAGSSEKTNDKAF